jgi:hypothetical protein
MELEQGVAFASWNSDTRQWEMPMGEGEPLKGDLSSLIARLGLAGWELVSAVPDTMVVESRNAITVDVATGQWVKRYALFVKKVPERD